MSTNEPRPLNVRQACAAYAAAKRWHGDDQTVVARAARDLVVANAGAMAAKAAVMLLGEPA